MSPTKIEKILHIEGMSCQNCVKRVKKILAEDNSLENIEVDLDAGNAHFLCQADTDMAALIEALREYDFSAKE